PFCASLRDESARPPPLASTKALVLRTLLSTRATTPLLRLASRCVRMIAAAGLRAARPHAAPDVHREGHSGRETPFDRKDPVWTASVGAPCRQVGKRGEAREEDPGNGGLDRSEREDPEQVPGVHGRRKDQQQSGCEEELPMD